MISKIKDYIGDFSFDHVGIAVHELQQGFLFYQALGFQKISVEEVPREKVKVGIIELKNQSRLELLEPTSEESPIAKFLNKKGPGIHHICLRVQDIDGVLLKLKTAKIQLINEEPVLGAHHCRVAFVHPRSTGGVLLELSQPIYPSEAITISTTGRDVR
ncbi:MAG: methylmalonyl-CoA epimerase [Bdellovibrionales bacterium]|nr:methylmalonyl-CoA epimerase [Bdellovibrionales bacterium]